MALSHHIPSVKPWEWGDVPQVWQQWAAIHLHVTNEVNRGPIVTTQGGR